jgi:hypothetical protein
MLTQTDVLIATRIYHDLNPLTGEEYELRDRLLRTGERSFVLMVAGEKPGDPEVAKSISLAGGPQIGFLFPVGEAHQGYLNLKAYKDFAAENREEGYTAWVTFAITPAAPEAPPKRPMIHK